jgi:Sec-independent protein translocase protein TatA
MPYFLLVLGPNKLPKVGKYLAKYLGGFRSASDEFKREIDVVVLEDKDPKEDTL